MAVNVETLEKLERKITLTLPVETIEKEVQSRLKRLARQVKLDGFRPGKVPLNVVAQRYGYSVHYEVMNDKVGEAFNAAANEAQLRVAGSPSIKEAEGAPEGQVAFDAVFEVYPEVKVGDLSAVEVERVQSEVTESAIDKTVDILRKQRRSFDARGDDGVVQAGDRLTVDFEGKIDGEPFEGGKAEGFQFLAGEGQMLREFEDAVQGMKAGESKTFQLSFPEDYHGKDVAGKQADFIVTVKKVEAQVLPELDAGFIASLGVAEGTVEALRADVRKNLEREVKFRVLARNKQAALDALVQAAELDLPKAAVQAELGRLVEGARADLKQRGVPDADKAPIPEDMFRPQAERRVRLGLVVAEVVRSHELHARPEQVKFHLDELASSYEQPEDVIQWYSSDSRRMADVEAVVIENNVTNWVLTQAKVADKAVDFDELMAQAR